MGTEARTRLALAAVLVVTLLSFGQVFDRGEYPGPALLGMLVAGVIAAGARRLGWSTSLTWLASVVGLLLYVTIVFQGRNSLYGLPTGASIEGLVRSIRRAYDTSLIDYAPVPVRPGYVLLTVIAMWSVTTIAEISTFRWRRPLVAVMPTVALVSFLAVVGTRVGATIVVLAYLAALMGFLAVESTLRLRAWGRWIHGIGGSGFGEALEVSGRLARRMGAASLAAALVAPIFLPALGDGLLTWRAGSGTGPGGGPGAIASGEIDLLASLRPTLLEQSSAELFRVVSPRPEYWRLTTLSSFDGTTWRPATNETPRPATAGVIEALGDPARFTSLVQNYTITGLRGEPMPAVAQPETVALTSDVEGRDLDSLFYEFTSGALKMNNGVVEGMSYEVTSRIPDLSYRRLREAEIVAADDTYTELPSELSQPVQDLVARWIAGAETPADQLFAIQDRLRGFDYSLDVEPLATTDYLTQFLTDTRVGYCQQFSAAFALLARHLGFPTRVAIGFLYGEVDISRPDHYIVRGTHAHSWPEVRFKDYGWVRFEPTPGNLATAPAYTIPPAEGFGDFGAIPPGERPPGGNPLNLQGNQNVPGGGRDRLEAAQDARRDRANANSQWQEAFRDLVTFLVLGLLVFICLVPVVKELRTAIAYRRARGPAAVAATAFRHFEREAADLASPRRPSESASGFMRRLAGNYRVPRENARQLAALYERAEYSRDGLAEDAADRAHAAARFLRGELWRAATWNARLRRLFSPASLFAR